MQNRPAQETLQKNAWSNALIASFLAPFLSMGRGGGFLSICRRACSWGLMGNVREGDGGCSSWTSVLGSLSRNNVAGCAVAGCFFLAGDPISFFSFFLPLFTTAEISSLALLCFFLIGDFGYRGVLRWARAGGACLLLFHSAAAEDTLAFSFSLGELVNLWSRDFDIRARCAFFCFLFLFRTLLNGSPCPSEFRFSMSSLDVLFVSWPRQELFFSFCSNRDAPCRAAVVFFHSSSSAFVLHYSRFGACVGLFPDYLSVASCRRGCCFCCCCCRGQGQSESSPVSCKRHVRGKRKKHVR